MDGISVLARPWLRRIIITVIAVLSLVGQLTPSAHATHLDGETFRFEKLIRFTVRKAGQTDPWFRFKFALYGEFIRFGNAVPGTFEFLDAGIDSDGEGGEDTPHLRGTYGPFIHSTDRPSTQQHKDAAAFDADSEGDVETRIVEEFLQALETKRGEVCDTNLQLLDLPALKIDTDAEGRVVMDLPALKLVGPAGCNGADPREWDVRVKTGATTTRGTQLP